MARTNQALKVAMAAVEQLPANLQRQLAEQVLTAVSTDELLVIPFKRLSQDDNERLQELMDKNNDGLLTRAERLELDKLVVIVDEMMLENSKSLARAMRPELFDENGDLIEKRARLTMGSATPKRRIQKRKVAQR